MDAQERIAELEAELVAKDAQIAFLEAEVARIPELERLVATLTEQVAAFLKQVADLQRKLGENSRNSNKPPSTDPPGAKKKKSPDKAGSKDKTSRKRGGQPGHPGSFRHLLPESEVDEFVDLFPSDCENCCFGPLPQVLDVGAGRSQHIEIPPIRPHVTETRRHEVTCPKCGHGTRPAHDSEKTPTSSFGPRLMSVVGVLTGVYHVSRRRTVSLLSDLFGLRISLGTVSAIEARVSAAVEEPVKEAWQKVENAEVKHTDGTGWKQAGVAISVWVIASTMATVFKIVQNSTKETLKALFGPLKGFLVSDRGSNLTFWVMERRQICWAHLLRKFVSFAERDGPAGDIGRELLDYTGLIFTYWHDFKDGKMSRDLFRACMASIRTQVEALLEKAVTADIEGLSGSCADILAHKLALWNFVDQEGVEPTNNHGEQELRTFVLWRKRSFGSQSERGSLYAERMMTVAHTARKQKRNVLQFITACCRAQVEKTNPPSLFVA